jgi:predicted Abi (CAAX) family protease
MNVSRVIHMLTHRFAGAFCTAPTGSQWALTAVIFGLFSLIAAPVGLGTGLLRAEVVRSWKAMAGILLVSLLFPAIAEEAIFRVALLPHPSEGAPRDRQLLWGSLGLVLFVASHPLKVIGNRSLRSVTFRSPVFLSLAALLGLACTAAYVETGSVWPPVVIHWGSVIVWLGFLGGYRRVSGSTLPCCSQSSHPSRQEGRRSPASTHSSTRSEDHGAR